MRLTVFLALLAACGQSHSNGAAGDSCKATNDCKMGLSCFSDPFPNGYCSADCSTNPCPDGTTCAPVAGASVCLKDCQSGSDCRSGYQCFGGVCTLRCMTNDDCGRGFVCTSGVCMPAPGAMLGAPCGKDADCSSQFCLSGVCSQTCNRDAACDATQTCLPNLSGTTITDACAARRKTAAPGATCTMDSDCDRGICLVGVCAELCVSSGDCHGSGMVCSNMELPLDTVGDASMLPKLQVCLPQSGTISYQPLAQWLPVPAHARAMSIYVFLPTFDFGDAAGVSSLIDPAGTAQYTPPTTIAAYYALPIRYAPAETSSVMQVPNSPSVKLTAGAWQMQYGAQSALASPAARVYYKLAAGAIAAGKLPLNFYITDLSAACATMTAADAATVLAGDITDMRNIFAQAGLTISDVTFHDVSGPNTIKVDTTSATSMLPDLDNILRTDTAGKGTTPGLDVVLVRQIQDRNGANSGVLGIAGGIPSAPELGTPHSGAVVSIETHCAGYFGPTAAHELAHTLGLYHNVEQDGHHDPLTDTAADGQNNLMYWIENQGRHLTVQQSTVIRDDVKVVQ